MKPLYLIAITILLLFTYCDKTDNEDNFFVEKYQKIYGEWQPVTIYGGNSNTGYQTPDFQSLCIEKTDRFKILSDQTICSGVIDIIKQTEDTLIVKLIPETGAHILIFCQQLVSFSGDTLILDEKMYCSDSYLYKFLKK